MQFFAHRTQKHLLKLCKVTNSPEKVICVLKITG
nr:MAG TPA: hypothetical protein [Caudoviricetes sp.]